MRTIYGTTAKGVAINVSHVPPDYLKEHDIVSLEFKDEDLKNPCPVCGIRERTGGFMYKCEECWYKEKFNS